MAGLFGAGIAVFLLSDLGMLLGFLALSLAALAAARLPPSYIWAQIRPFVVMISLFLAAHAVLTSFETGLVVVTRFAVMVVLGLLVAMTTRLSAVIAILEKVLAPIALIGLDPAKAGLVLSMTIRFIPLVGEAYRDISAAQKARGLERNFLALMVPLLIKLLQRADAISDALIARGVDD